MKSTWIILALVAPAAAAWISRPAEADFWSHLADRKRALSPAEDAQLDRLNDAQVVDHGFWVSVEKDGRTFYVGAFNRWFELSASDDASLGQTAEAGNGWYQSIGASGS